MKKKNETKRKKKSNNNKRLVYIIYIPKMKCAKRYIYIFEDVKCADDFFLSCVQ